MRHASSLPVVFLFGLGVTLAAPDALAKAEFASSVPNYAPYGCDTCHPTGTTSSENAFGLDVEPLVGMPIAQWWPMLYDLDSDGDGQTNGEELGDPCGDWTTGKTPARNTNISNPGNAASLSADPKNPDCGAGSGATTATGAVTTGAATTGSGSAATGTSTTGGGTSGAGGASGAGSAGSGENDSTGPGMADPPPPGDYGSCSVGSPRRGSLASFAALACLALALVRRRQS